VDAASGTAGKYALNLTLTPGPFCGDGKVDPNEACDAQQGRQRRLLAELPRRQR